VGTGFALLLAVAGVAAYLIVGGTPDRKAGSVLPTRVVGMQAVGIANTGPAPQAGAGPAPETLLASHSALVFTVNGPGGAQWTSDQMAGGTYIFIYLPNGLCLASRAGRRAPTVTLEHCDLQASQRWLRLHTAVGSNGLDYWQLRNLADRQCLAAGKALGTGESEAQLRPCEASPGWRQQMAFPTAP
jgi:hypothetical protein